MDARSLRKRDFFVFSIEINGGDHPSCERKMSQSFS